MRLFLISSCLFLLTHSVNAQSPCTSKQSDNSYTVTCNSSNNYYTVRKDAIHKVFGQSGNDKLVDDIFNVSNTQSYFYGDSGNDTLVSGMKKAFLTGGTGKDIFYFNLDARTTPFTLKESIIADFNQYNDKIMFKKKPGCTNYNAANSPVPPKPPVESILPTRETCNLKIIYTCSNREYSKYIYLYTPQALLFDPLPNSEMISFTCDNSLKNKVLFTDKLL